MKLEEPKQMRDKYMSKEISHREYYLWMADQLGRESVGRNIPATDAEIKASTDEHLNDIPLARWDNKDPVIRRLAFQAGFKSWSLSDTVCVLKNLALEHFNLEDTDG